MRTIFFTIALLAGCLYAAAETPDTSFAIRSPNKKVTTTLSIKGGKAMVQVNCAANDMLYPSPFAMRLCDAATGKRQWTLGEGIRKKPHVTIDTLVTDRSTPVSRQARVRGKATRMTLNCGDYDIEALAANDGCAYRFVSRIKGQVRVLAETDNLRLPRGCTLWYQTVKTYDTSFEEVYRHNPIGKVEQGVLLAPQLLVTSANSRARLLLSDYDVRDYPGLYWQLSGDTLKSVFAPLPKTVAETGNLGSRTQVTEREPYIAITEGTRSFPWKMLALAEHDYDLLMCTLPAQLASPSRIDDPSWIKPGKAAWEWWNAANLTGAGFSTGINDSTYQAYIDFAAQNHLQYVLLDAGWTAQETPLNLLHTVPEINIGHLVDYAGKRGVGIILWTDYHPFEQNMEKYVEAYARMGVKGFKIDHMNRNDQQIVQFMWRAAELCAKHHMLLDFHGTMPPTGLHYVWPNVLSYEAVHGLERMKGEQGGRADQVTYDVVFPFIRQVVGPVDYTPGAMRNSTRSSFRAVATQPMSQGTRARQAAEYVVFESPLSMLCDAPSSYTTPYNQPWTDFVSQIPATWDESRVLRGQVGNLIVMARRKGDTWWIGGMSNWAARSNIRIMLDFVKNDNKRLTVLSDGLNADRDASDYRIDKLEMGANKLVDIDIKPGGGFVLRVD